MEQERVEIWLKDLSKEVQKKLCKMVGIEKPEDAGWHTRPVFVYENGELIEYISG